MCMLIHLSTTSDLDLTQFDDPELPLRFERITELNELEGHLVSSYPHKWHLTRWGGCSCHFRTAAEVFDTRGTFLREELFQAPNDWCPEDPDDIDGTQRVYGVIRRLLESGADVDCVQVWNEHDLVCHLHVSLAEVPKVHFSFAKGYCYHFKL